MPAISDLIVKISADHASFRADIEKVEARLSSLEKKASAASNALKFPAAANSPMDKLAKDGKAADTIMGRLSQTLRDFRREETQQARTTAFFARELGQILPASAGGAAKALGILAAAGTVTGLALEGVKLGVTFLIEEFTRASREAEKFAKATAKLAEEGEKARASLRESIFQADMSPAERQFEKDRVAWGKQVEIARESLKDIENAQQAHVVEIDRIQKITPVGELGERVQSQQISRLRSEAKDLEERRRLAAENLDKAEKSRNESLKAGADLLKDHYDLERKRLRAAEQARAAAESERLYRGVLKDIPAPVKFKDEELIAPDPKPVDKWKEHVGEADVRFQRFALNVQRGSEATDKWVKEWSKDWQEDQKKRFTEAKRFADEISGGIFDAFEDNLFKPWDDAIKGMGESFTKMLARIALKAAEENLASLLAGGFMSLGIPGRAAGGTVGHGGTYLVGERGPELFVPNVNGHITPNHELSRAAAAPSQMTLVVDRSTLDMTFREALERTFADVRASR